MKENSRFRVIPESKGGVIADALLSPLMFLGSGMRAILNFETPQRTHAWNYTLVTNEDVDHLNLTSMIHESGMEEEGDPQFKGHRHLPLLGGWRNYIVLDNPSYHAGWFVGWISQKHVGVSRVPIFKRSVRMLIGPEPVSFFAVRLCDGAQMKLWRAGRGRIGDGSFYSTIMLL